MNTPAGARRPNRLIHATSPYLLQHAYNPVDWHPWGPEALARAREEDKLIFLSIGYAACHWCHVMEREVFEKESVASALARDFVSIKVDREERPDVDAQYMLAAQLMTGGGGWPLSAFLTPNLDPILAAGRYFPEDAFLHLLAQLARAWRTARGELSAQALQVSAALRAHAGSGGSALVPSGALEEAVRSLAGRFDEERGGFSLQPKFPMAPVLRLLCDAARGGDERAAAMLHHTLGAMARGGIHDHVGGGFFRYSTDRMWLVPHFEKMLYDQAQLLEVYSEAYTLRPDPAYREAAMGIVRFVLRELRHESGAFFSSLDADSEGEEGKFYVFAASEVRSVLGVEAERFLRVYGVTERGNFEHGRSVLGLVDEGSGVGAMRDCLDALFDYRARRVRPATDDKVLSGWNALMIEGLCRAAEVFAYADALDAAEEAAKFILTEMVCEGALQRAWREGRVSGEGFLADYAYLLQAFVSLSNARRKGEYLTQCEWIAQRMVDRFWDDEQGGFFDYADTGDHVARLKTAEDNAEPSGNGVAALALTRLADVTGDTRWRGYAHQTVRAFGAMLRDAPSFGATLLRASQRLVPDLPKVTVSVPERVVVAERLARVPVMLTVPTGWRIYAAGEEAPAGRLSVRLEDLPSEWQWETRMPEPTFQRGDAPFYQGPVEVSLHVTLPEDVIAGE
ncbi:MAG: hypothetical protein AMXMBFR61_14380 [Fimbriimonadales bacterium]